MTDTSQLVEIRWHGRGGQGAVTSAELLARAAINEGRYAQAFPKFGMERRGAPVMAFDRIGRDEPIWVRADVAEPDIVVVLDPTLISIVNVTSGLKDDGLLVINTRKSMEELESTFGTRWRMATVNAAVISREELGVAIVNTTMLGALLRSVPVVNMESMEGPLKDRFNLLAERNINAMRRAFRETVIKE